MSSHREAPGLLCDPCADNTDTYAWVTPNDTVTIITNYVPVQAPAGGPNFYEFGEDVRYEINVDNSGDGKPNVTYRFEFKSVITNPNTFLYNTGPITSLNDPNWNRRQFYTVTRIKNGRSQVLAKDVPCPPCNIGPRSTPNYETLAASAVRDLGGGRKVFCGQRADAFFVDLGSVFDLGTLRPFQSLHLIPGVDSNGVDALAKANVHTIALQVPIAELTRSGRKQNDVMSKDAVIGVWGAASRQRGTMRTSGQPSWSAGPYVQVSRLGNPLFNEVLVPMARKDEWNGHTPHYDYRFTQYVAQPELAKLLPVLYPKAFPNLKALTANRHDLIAILLTGLRPGLVKGFQNYTGTTAADELRLNTAIPPASSPNSFGLLGGDPAGFPNGRRLIDNIVKIELRAVAGLTYPLINPSYVPDQAASLVDDGTEGTLGRTFLPDFPYIGTPYAGYDVPAPAPA